jgi:hypothetical protein
VVIRIQAGDIGHPHVQGVGKPGCIRFSHGTIHLFQLRIIGHQTGLIELGVVEQRHNAVLAVLGGLCVTESPSAYGVTHQTAHRWLRWYAQGGIPAGRRAARTR